MPPPADGRGGEGEVEDEGTGDGGAGERNARPDFNALEALEYPKRDIPGMSAPPGMRLVVVYEGGSYSSAGMGSTRGVNDPWWQELTLLMMTTGDP